MRKPKTPSAYTVSTYLLRVIGLFLALLFAYWAVSSMGPLIHLAF